MRPELILDNKFVVAFYEESHCETSKVAIHKILHEPNKIDAFYVWSEDNNGRVILSSGEVENLEQALLYGVTVLDVNPSQWEPFEQNNDGPMYTKPYDSRIFRNKKVRKKFNKLQRLHVAWLSH